MKRSILFTLALFAAISLSAQVNPADTVPLFKQYPIFPPFKFDRASDSSKFSKEDLKKKKPILLMIFSPECDHCQHETKDMLDHIDQFKGIQIVMITWLPYDEMKKFYNDYQIGNYPSITMARDPSFNLPPWYKVVNLPFLAMYDKKGRLITSMDGSVSVEKILGVFD